VSAAVEQMAAAIHVALCEDSPDECLEYHGYCWRAAEAAHRAAVASLEDTLKAVQEMHHWHCEPVMYKDKMSRLCTCGRYECPTARLVSPEPAEEGQ
jgi:hypothetical protein